MTERSVSPSREEGVNMTQSIKIRSELQLWLDEPESRWETIDADDTDNLDADTQLGAWLSGTPEPGTYRCVISDVAGNADPIAVSAERTVGE